MHSNNFPDAFYRVSVKGIFVHEGKVLLVKEPPELTDKWELPGGGLDFGEDPKLGLKREVEEELGLKVTKMSEYPVYVWPARFEGWRNMDWYYSMVLAYRIELESLDFKTSNECKDIRLYAPEELHEVDIFLQSAPLREHFKLEDFKEWK
jgi:8-oxo-dGTP diphosphatase